MRQSGRARTAAQIAPSRTENPGSAAKVSASSRPRSTIDRQPAPPRARMDERSPALGVDDPEFVDAMARIEPRLEAPVVGEARHRDFDRQQDVRALDLFELDAPRIDDEIRFDESVGAQIDRRLNSEPEVIGQRARNADIERRLDELMDVRLRLHRHDLAFDQLEVLVLRDDAGVLHAQDFGHRERPAVEALGGAGDVGSHVFSFRPPPVTACGGSPRRCSTR